MADVFGVDDEFDGGVAGIAGMGFDGADVGVGVADGGGDFFQHAGAVVAVDGELDGVGLGAAGFFFWRFGPLDGDAAVGLVEQILNVGTIAGVDGDTFAAGDVADDFFAANGVTTFGTIDEELVLAFDDEGFGTAAGVDAANGFGAGGERRVLRAQPQDG